jgi:hypothetical protein
LFFMSLLGCEVSWWSRIAVQHQRRALEDPWWRVESREYVIYLVLYEILCGCPRGDRLRAW